ncbi:pPIWI_RE module domain-containing protein [Kitasatospora sp. NPDC059811]|uniref:pPIWI_RE module domain-containing protein n=1 Tax=Streptomycetaceae TaxID=2062 RepID=UPI0007AFDC98|nr:DUF3962 domain-containing protein [Streptomyces sp. MJM8645]
MWESQLEGHEGRNTLAPLLDLSPGGPVPLSEVLQRDEHGRIIGPHWAFRVAGWRIAEMLAAAPLPLGNGQEIPFLLDTEGGLISWHDPLVAEEEWIDKKSGQLVKRAGHAMDRIQVDVEPGPGGLALVAHLSPRISRVATNWKGIRNVYLNHNVNTEVILKAPVKIQWTVEDGRRVVKSVEYKGAAAKVVEKCGVSRLPEAPTALGELGPVQGVHRTQEHLIGTGPGARLKALLTQHAANVLGIEPITYDGTPVRISAASPKEFPAPCVLPDKFPQALQAVKNSGMTIAVLYSSLEWKSRVLRQIGRDYDLPKLVESEDEQTSHLAPGLILVTLRIPELVLHGRRDRAKIINSLP